MYHITGKVYKVLFTDKESGFSICLIKVLSTDIPDEDYDTLISKSNYVTAKGIILNVMQGEELKLQGKIIKDRKYGLQFDISKFERTVSQSKAGVVKYLSSSKFAGIGIKTAEKIVKELGNDCLDKIAADINILDTISISDKHKSIIKEGIAEYSHDKVYVQLRGLGLSDRVTKNFLLYYDNNAYEQIKKDPYIHCMIISGYSFQLADSVANTFGIEENDLRRVKAYIYFTVSDYIYKTGSTYMLYNDLVNTVYEYMELDDVNTTKIDKIIDDLFLQNKLYKNENQISLYNIFNAEYFVSTFIRNLVKKKPLAIKKVDAIINNIEDNEQLKYSQLQRQAIEQALSNHFFVLTGGPGTGKTTVVKGIINAFIEFKRIKYKINEHELKIALCAPTGKASRRLSISSGFESSTIHKLLGYSADNPPNVFTHNEQNQLDLDLLIVDEASMIDIELAYSLFSAISHNTKVIVVGDFKQLPSIGPGQFLKDLIDCVQIPKIVLNVIHRQGSESSVIKLAQLIQDEDVDSFIEDKRADFAFFDTDKYYYQDNIKRILLSAMNKGYDIIDDVQVLIPMYKTEVGIIETNRILQEALNPPESFKEEMKFLGTVYRVGDKVLQLKNNPNLGIMNGDVGKIIKIVNTEDISELTILFDAKEVVIQRSELSDLSLGYAVSIHKSQGSEYKICVIPVFSHYSYMLNKNLLYTAVTRTKQSLVLLGDKSTFSYSCTKQASNRSTNLLNYISLDQLAEDISSARNKQKDNTKIKTPNLCFEYLGEENPNDLTPYSFI